MLEVRNVPIPDIAPDEVLIRVHASSVNAYDWHMLRGKPYIARLSEGVRRPKDPRVGVDVAGVVESVGPSVESLRPGDRVFGSCAGAFAEFATARAVVPMPSRLAWTEAAALPGAGVTALQGLRDKAGLRPGQRVLILGAGGGVGTMAVQIAKALGAEVTAATRPARLDLVRSIGADDVVDYTKTDLTHLSRRYDVVLDIAGTTRLSRLAKLIEAGGTLVMVAPDPGQWIGPVARVATAVVLSRLGRRRFQPFLATVNRDDLLVLKELADGGKLRPVIDRQYPLEQAADAVRHVESGKAGGKVVLVVRPPAAS